ncbi:MAG TPA: ABC transporter permease [Pseudonocardiaceae bacterium]|jgi:hypothetical protein|nr:ABC transporter permease [Pseudonocardiaceae bacterium]
MNTLVAEFRKLVALPSTLVAIGITLVCSLGITVLNVSQIHAKLASGNTDSMVNTNLVNTVFTGPSTGVIGVIVLGVVIVSSEYTANTSDAGGGRQIVTSLTCVPRRGQLLAAKGFVLVVVSGALGAVLVPVTILVSRAILGQYARPLDQTIDNVGGRMVAGIVGYWICAALITFSITVLARHGTIPLIAFIANTSVVSIDLLLAKFTPIGKFLPDVAGSQMFSVNYPAPHMLSPAWGGTVMGLWTVGLLGVAATVFVRRDA